MKTKLFVITALFALTGCLDLGGGGGSSNPTPDVGTNPPVDPGYGDGELVTWALQARSVAQGVAPGSYALKQFGGSVIFPPIQENGQFHILSLATEPSMAESLDMNLKYDQAWGDLYLTTAADTCSNLASSVKTVAALSKSNNDMSANESPVATLTLDLANGVAIVNSMHLAHESGEESLVVRPVIAKTVTYQVTCHNGVIVGLSLSGNEALLALTNGTDAYFANNRAEYIGTALIDPSVTFSGNGISFGATDCGDGAMASNVTGSGICFGNQRFNDLLTTQSDSILPDGFFAAQRIHTRFINGITARSDLLSSDVLSYSNMPSAKASFWAEGIPAFLASRGAAESENCTEYYDDGSPDVLCYRENGTIVGVTGDYQMDNYDVRLTAVVGGSEIRALKIDSDLYPNPGYGWPSGQHYTAMYLVPGVFDKTAISSFKYEIPTGPYASPNVVTVPFDGSAGVNVIDSYGTKVLGVVRPAQNGGKSVMIGLTTKTDRLVSPTVFARSGGWLQVLIGD
nr:hypothetical protein BdHM001_36540 [Bdellovibrio sp. HM001]